MPAFEKLPQSDRPTTGKVMKIGMGNCDLTTGKGGFLRAVTIAAPLTSGDFEPYDKVAIHWRMDKPYITANLSDPGSTRSGNQGVSYISYGKRSSRSRFEHKPVTITSEASAVLEIDVDEQKLDLDVQSANTVLAGPTSGSATHPRFRALVEDDLPAEYWRTDGNADITGSKFIGTTTTTDLIAKVNSVQGWRLVYTGGSPSIVGGWSGNTVGTTVGSTIAGGGASGKVQTIGANYATISGGLKNTISTAATYGTIAGGYKNYVYSKHAVICGGRENEITGTGGAYNTIGGGRLNTIDQIGAGALRYNTIGGGLDNRIRGYNYNTISGGCYNDLNPSCQNATIGGGYGNVAHTNGGVIAGGFQNEITYTSVYQDGNVISGGVRNTITDNALYACIPGGCRAKADKTGQMAYAAGYFGADGDAQTSPMTQLRRSVTHVDDSWYELYLDGSSEQITIATNALWYFSAKVIGHASGNASAFGYRVEGMIKNDGGTTTLLDSSTVYEHDSDCPSFDIRARADDTNDALVIEVQDAGSNNARIRWKGSVWTEEAGYPKPS